MDSRQDAGGWIRNNMKAGKILVVDVGTSSIRVACMNDRANIAGIGRRKYQPVTGANGRIEQNPSLWVEGLGGAIRDCLEVADSAGNFGGPDSILAVAITAARSSVIAVDADGKAVADAIMWQDERANSIVAGSTEYEDLIYRRTGMRLSNITSSAKMAWLRRNEPEIYGCCAKLVGIQGFLIRKLTGDFVTDFTFGNRTGLMNINSRQWDEEILRVFDIERSRLPELCPPGEIVGTISPEGARITGLKEGVPVISAGGDQQCAAVGQGVIKPGVVSVNTGTGAFVVRSLESVVHDSERGLLVNISSIPGQYILEAIVPAAGCLYQWFCEILAIRHRDDNIYRQIDREIEETPPGSNGVISIPNFSGQGSPYWNPEARGAFLNLRIGTRRGDMARALLEGVVSAIINNLERMRQLDGRESDIFSAGGLSVFSAYNQMLADQAGREIRLHEFTESTIMGVWVVAAVRLGLYSSYVKAYSQVSGNDFIRIFQPDERRTSFYKGQNRLRGKVYSSLSSIGWEESFFD